MNIDIFNTDRKYRVIYADPAWQFNNKNTGGSMTSSAEAQYTVTSLADMAALPVAKLADDHCMLVMWWVGSMPQEAIDLCKAWGFRLVNMNGFVWRKMTKRWLPHFGMGFTTRAGSESALIGVRGKLKHLIKDHSVRAVIEAEVGKHSQKPNEFRFAIEKMCGAVEQDVPRIELFARESAAGWDCWGNEAPAAEATSAPVNPLADIEPLHDWHNFPAVKAVMYRIDEVAYLTPANTRLLAGYVRDIIDSGSDDDTTLTCATDMASRLLHPDEEEKTSLGAISYGSVCSGVEAASLAWEKHGLKPAWFAEIEPFPSAVLAHNWPHVANLGDMTKIASSVIKGDVVAPDILVGGTPCQAFSVAGAREGLADDRGFLTIKYVELANAIDKQRTTAGKAPCITVWENVPGVLSSKDNAFGAFLGFLAGEDCELIPPGKKWENAGCVLGPQRAIAWRILDAQYFGVAQRRRRVFVVASAREGFDPAKVLFECEGVRRDSAPSRESGKAVAALTANGVGTCGADDNQGQAGHLIPASLQITFDRQSSGEYGTAPIASTVSARDFKGASDLVLSIHGTQDPDTNVELAHTLGRNQGQENAVLVKAVRRLTPVECERLQGFPDGHTDVPYRGKLAADGPRYKAIGNSMAVPCMEFIGQRIIQALMEEA
ncbi:MT-A70 family methyltransferase [Aeromonas veronii]|uniref:MT-A70 family methyltransferase n=1 Tax=Aeromonas veronii TaxID=654 RepID=UPI0028532C0D|nr:MT-A70 family methyltransferase [Aeromonas veronii]MDR5013454.1 MT-A70 family methyltransferase [Aeromonas veronii]